VGILTFSYFLFLTITVGILTFSYFLFLTTMVRILLIFGKILSLFIIVLLLCVIIVCF
jgi:hypothetical protein